MVFYWHINRRQWHHPKPDCSVHCYKYGYKSASRVSQIQRSQCRSLVRSHVVYIQVYVAQDTRRLEASVTSWYRAESMMTAVHEYHHSDPSLKLYLFA